MKFRYPTAYYALTLALALLCIPDAFAARIFVSQAPNASDNNVGNYRNPLRTIGAAVKKADSGDTVVVGAGDYSQEQNGFGTDGLYVLNIHTMIYPVNGFCNQLSNI